MSENVLLGHASQAPTPGKDLLLPGEQGLHAKSFSILSYPPGHSQSAIDVLASRDALLSGHALQASILSAVVEMPL